MELSSLTELPDEAVAAMVAHARFCFPEEACGLIAGERIEGRPRFRMLYSLTNADASPVEYTIAPAEHFGALSHAESNGWELMGAFHSHPHGVAYPSETDVERAAEPDWTWFVVGLGADEASQVAGYSIRNGQVEQVYPPAG